MRDFRDSKNMAKTLREALAAKNVAFSQSESLELISRMFGLPNWNVLAAKIETARAEHILAADPAKAAPDAPRTPAISPFLIVGDVNGTIAFYCDKLGFSVGYKEPAEAPFFAIIYRDGAQIFIKSERGVLPVPNNSRHSHLRWDAYIFAPDPDALAADFSARGTAFSSQLKDTHDGLRGFEVADPDGYVLFFGRPQ